MKYKALMLDVDGTLIPYQYDALPSKKVKKAIEAARKKGVIVCAVTGRSLPSTTRVLESLGVKDGYAVVDGGAMVVDLGSGKLLYEKYVEKSDMDEIIRIFEDEGVDIFVKDKTNLHKIRERYEPFEKGTTIEDVTMIFTDELFTKERSDDILGRLSIPTIAVHRSQHRIPGKYSFSITHAEATKLHGIVIISELLNLERDEIIGIGDGYNDFPLLMASGLKVAMGNAIQDLKDIADVVAPSVDEDGVAFVVEKYLLS